jgi:AbrB family looped-hinge helix DNA binding protein
MGKGSKTKTSTESGISTCCKVEAVISIDERGQMVLPKEIRDKANIQAGDKLAILSWEMGEKINCISLIKTDDFAGMVKEMLGPMMKEISQS